MKIIEYFTSDNQEHWLNEIRRSDWGAGQFLYTLLKENRLKEAVGETALVPMLTEGEKLVSFCTFAPLDDIQPTDLGPWIGFVYTFPEYWGHRYAGLLLNYAESIAAIMDRKYVYISTGHTGLYETYGYEFLQIAKDMEGEDSRVYRKALDTDGPEKEKRLKDGTIWKAEIVAKAKEQIDMTAICGFSCSHCFLGEWCGGCRSVFSSCSYGTMFAGGRCPNVVCCREKKLEGCYECPELEHCQKGFYEPGNDGASACKAQAIFIKKHGKEAFFGVHDRLHEQYDFRKTQEILSTSVSDGLRILEENM